MLPTSFYWVAWWKRIEILPGSAETRSFRKILVGYKTSFRRLGCVSRQVQSLQICFGESVCAFIRLLGVGELRFSGGLDFFLFFFFFFSSLHSDVLYGSYNLCYPRPGLIWHHELVGVMADLVHFCFLLGPFVLCWGIMF